MPYRGPQFELGGQPSHGQAEGVPVPPWTPHAGPLLPPPSSEHNENLNTPGNPQWPNRANVAASLPRNSADKALHISQVYDPNMLAANMYQNVANQPILPPEPQNASPMNRQNRQAAINKCPPQQQASNNLNNQFSPQMVLNNTNPNYLVNLVPATPTLNNQVPPGNRANNYWDNFRSYSRQNLLSSHSKTNADGNLNNSANHCPHPLTERSHNSLHEGAAVPPLQMPSTNTPKRNTNSLYQSISNSGSQASVSSEPSNRRGRRNFSQDSNMTATPDVLNINQNLEEDSNPSNSINLCLDNEDSTSRLNNVINFNVNRESLSERNLNVAHPVPEIIQGHSNNLAARPVTSFKKKSSSKLPAKNSSGSNNYSLEYAQNMNLDLNGGSLENSNPNLASTSRDNNHDKSTSKLFDLLRENVYSEVTALISANEAHPHFLIQLFRDLQLISSDPLREHTLQSIRELLSNRSEQADADIFPNINDTNAFENLDATDRMSTSHLGNDENLRENYFFTPALQSNIRDYLMVHSNEICNPTLLEALKQIMLNNSKGMNEKKAKEILSKFEGMKVYDIADEILNCFPCESHERSQANASIADNSSVLSVDTSDVSMQDVAGSLITFFGTSEQRLMNSAGAIPEENGDSQYESIDFDNSQGESSSSVVNSEDVGHQRNKSDAKVDLIESVDVYNGDLAEADQKRHSEQHSAPSTSDGIEMLPDIIDTEEPTPTEAEAEWLGLDRVPTRLHTDDNNPANQTDQTR